MTQQPNTSSRQDGVVLIGPGSFVRTIFNATAAHKVLDVKKVGAGVQIRIETYVAGQRSESLIRGTEVAEVINGNEVTKLRSASVALQAAQLKDQSLKQSHLYEPKPASIKLQAVSDPTPAQASAVPPAKPKPTPSAGGDYVAELLARVPYREVAEKLGMDVPALDQKYAHLDAPKQRMCFGNLIRARYRKNPEQFSVFNK